MVTRCGGAGAGGSCAKTPRTRAGKAPGAQCGPRGGAGAGGCCANAAGTRLAKATEPNAAPRLRHDAGERIRAEPMRTATALVIDDHTPGNAADRDGDDRLAALGIDDGDVVAETVGD